VHVVNKVRDHQGRIATANLLLSAGRIGSTYYGRLPKTYSAPVVGLYPVLLPSVLVFLQNKLRQLTRSVRVADCLRSAAYEKSSRPLHSLTAPPPAYAASKEVSEHIPDRSEPFLPGWLASLATFGVAAGVYATNTEQVPLTGRKQLLFNWSQPTSTAHISSSLPREAIKVNPYQHKNELFETGSVLMQSLYQQAALGTETLALKHPDLQRRLSALPSTVQLCHKMAVLQPNASFSGGRTHTWHKLWTTRRGEEIFKMSMTSGMLLQQETPQALQWVMAHEMGHGIAKHQNEDDSWRMLITGSVFGRLALGAMPLGVLPAVAAGDIVSRLACWMFVDIHLHQQQGYEADVLGAAISKAAGCRTDDIVTAMARMHIDELLRAGDIFVTSGCASIQEKALPDLKRLLPNIHLPDTIADSSGLATFVDSIKEDLQSASDKVCVEACTHLNLLWMTVGFRLGLFRHPLSTMIGSHPHWLHRIANITQSSMLKDMGCDAPTNGTYIKTGLEKLAIQLQDYQSEWAGLMYFSRQHEGDLLLRDDYDSCESIRSRSQQFLPLEMAEESSKEFGLASQAFVVMLTAYILIRETLHLKQMDQSDLQVQLVAIASKFALFQSAFKLNV